MKTPALLLSLMLATCHSPGADAALQLVELEYAFAKSVAAKGISPGFFEFLAPDGIIFQPQPTLGREWHRTNSSPSRLIWQPELAVLSAGGDLGYTTGPWRYFADATSAEALACTHGLARLVFADHANQPTADAAYLRVWHRSGTGGWELAAEIALPLPPEPKASVK